VRHPLSVWARTGRRPPNEHEPGTDRLVRAEFEGRKTNESLYAKLDVVCTYLQDEGLAGTVDSPASFFAGTCEMTWGPVSDAEGVVYFTGETHSTSFGLGGSAKHVLGATGTGHLYSGSMKPVLLAALARRTGMQPEPGHQDNERWQALELSAVMVANYELRGASQRMEFFAKRLLEGPPPPYWGWTGDPRRDWRTGADLPFTISRILLGTPIYVAMAD
jgi:hypothetical protein